MDLCEYSLADEWQGALHSSRQGPYLLIPRTKPARWRGTTECDDTTVREETHSSYYGNRCRFLANAPCVEIGLNVQAIQSAENEIASRLASAVPLCRLLFRGRLKPDRIQQRVGLVVEIDHPPGTSS